MKKILVLVAIFCLVCSSVFAFDRVANLLSTSSEKSSEEIVEVKENSSPKLTATSINLEALSTKVDDLVFSKAKKAEILEAIEVVEEDVKAIEKELTAPKFLLNAGVALGYDGDFIIGAIGSFGIRLGHGLMLNLGAEYDFFKTFKFEGEAPENVIKIGENWGVVTTINGYNNLKATFTLGWEF